MLIVTEAKALLRQVGRWERNAIGVTSLLPASLQRRLWRAIRKSLLPEGRRHISPDRLEDLFRTFDERGTAYVVCRWFRDLPREPDGDIDFLVADDAIADFNELLDGDRDGIPCDVYSESGLQGYRYGDIPYYPRELARKILEHRVSLPGHVNAPCTEDHFLSLAYHCLYHKGPDCGLPTTTAGVRPVRTPNHDYRGTLSALADQIGVSVELDMEALDSFLDERGWRPPREILNRLAVDNPWIQRRFAS